MNVRMLIALVFSLFFCIAMVHLIILFNNFLLDYGLIYSVFIRFCFIFAVMLVCAFVFMVLLHYIGFI